MAKQCPFFKEECKGMDCQIFHPKVKDCSIAVIIYNIYKLNNSMEKTRLQLSDIERRMNESQSR